MEKDTLEFRGGWGMSFIPVLVFFSFCILLFIVFLSCISLILSSCKSSKSSTGNKNMITIAYQYGLAYAPLEIMKQEKIMENNLPRLEVLWKL